MNKSESKYFNTARRMDEALLSLLSEKDFEYITIKELCDRAQVNRSTFYLHYENIADLLEEAVSVVNERFNSSFSGTGIEPHQIENMPLEELFLITDQWILPYLDFIRENRRIYKAIYTQMDVFGVEKTYYQMFQTVFSPILLRYGVDIKKHEYIMSFYRHGMAAVIMKWVEGGCRERPGEIAEIIKQCVGGPGR